MGILAGEVIFLYFSRPFQNAPTPLGGGGGLGEELGVYERVKWIFQTECRELHGLLGVLYLGR